MSPKRKRPRRDPPATVEYADPDGNLLTLRQSLSAGTTGEIIGARARGPATVDDDWRRRMELVFERLVVRWEIAGLPLDDQKLLLGRYRMADDATQRWVRRTISDHVAHHIPELTDALSRP